ncbi:MAG: aspartate kinase [Anaerolineae bacterium]|nr:aspartate kinase [Anaerolineae bacterium]
MIVHKFGGTSVGNAERFAAVADLMIGYQNDAAQGGVVIVVSAMGGVTNALVAGARAAAEGKDTVYRGIKADLLNKHLSVVEALLGHSPERLDVGGFVEDRLHDLERLYRSVAVLGELTARGLDAVASFGEQLSSNILAAVLRERGVRAQAISATQIVVTDDVFGGATPLMDQTRSRLEERVKPLVDRGVIPVITGYIGATADGVTTTLGRGGSDYTAAIVGAGLEADEVWIWSDVSGILTADPNIVPQARTLRELSYAEAAELAYYGANVLHPKTIRPVIENDIPLRIANSFDPAAPMTLIVKTPSADRDKLPAIISTTGLSLIAVSATANSSDGSWSLDTAASILHSLSQAGIDVPMFSQSFSEHSLNLIVREQDQAHCLKVLHSAFGDERAAFSRQTTGLEVKEQVATISVVGTPGWKNGPAGIGGGIVAYAFATLGAHGTRVIAVAQAGTEYAVSFCIPEEQVQDTVRYLHKELGLEK